MTRRGGERPPAVGGPQARRGAEAGLRPAGAEAGREPLEEDGVAHDDLRMRGGLERGRTVTITVDGLPLSAYEGESLAAALFAAGRRSFRTSPRGEAPRGYFCGMGICHDCLMTVDGLPNVRACTTPVRDGLRAETQAGLGRWEGR